MLMLFKALLLTVTGANTQAFFIKTHVNPYNVVVGPVLKGKEPLSFLTHGLTEKNSIPRSLWPEC